MYSVNGEKLRTIHDWATLFERFWEHKLLRIKGRAEAAAGSDSAKSHLAKSATAKSATAKSATAKSDSAKPSGKAAHPKATDSQEP